ncbi:MAG: PQQ-binding-like beta-propeller repeat protein [Alphaproteobacteria bacterium]|nr:PQQ-binding-like beta-propeller repeat protein [Alphaproteobacteria bacterium]
MKKFKATILLVAVCAALAGCSMFKGLAKKDPDLDKTGRVNMSLADQKLTADPELAATTVEIPAPVANKDWPQEGLTPNKHTGDVAAAADLKVKWRVNIGQGSNRKKRLVAPPVIADGRLYVIDADQKVSALDADTGRRIWSKQLKALHKKDNTAIGGGLAVAGDKLLVSSGFGYLAALSTADGKELWRERTDSPLSGSPAVIGPRAFVTSTDNQIYAFDVNTGEIIWSDQAIAESARILSSPSPAVNEDLLVAPYTSGELIAYLPANGRRLWQDTLTTIGRFTPLSAINDIAGHPTIEGGIAYAASYSGVLTAIDTRSGQRLWAILFGSRLGPIVAGDYLFIVGVEGQVACIQKIDGKVVWVRNLPEYKKVKKKKGRIVWTGPLIASNRLIVVNSEGELLALSPQTGETTAEMKLGSDVLIQPVAANGLMYVLTDKGQLIAIR